MSRGRAALCYGLGGFVGLPVVVFTILLLISLNDPHCRNANSGGCEMATFFAAILSSVPGLVVGAIVGAFVGGPRDEKGSTSAGPDGGRASN